VIGLALYLLQQLGMPETRNKVGRVHEPVRAIVFTHGVGDAGPERHLNSLNGVHDEKPQLPVEIAAQVKGSPFAQKMI
jgi:hypothetical protein